MSRNAESLRKEAPQLISKGVELYSADIITTATLPAADIVIHAAASTDVSKYLSRPLSKQENIQAGTYNYCSLAKKYHSESKILYVSSGAVYGKQPANLTHIPEDYVANDLIELPDGKRDYAFAKRAAENAIKNLGLEGLSVSIARCFTFVGPWLPRNQHFAIGNFIEDALQGRPIKVNATKKVYRSYMYADDLVEWLMTIVCHAIPICPIYNVGSDEVVTIKDLSGLISGVFGLEVHIPKICDSSIDRYIPSIDKAKEKLGLRLIYDLISALQNTHEKIYLKLK